MSSSNVGAEVEPEPVVKNEESRRVSAAVAPSPSRKSQSSPATASGGALVTESLLQLAEAIRTIVPKGTWQSLGSEKEIELENAAGVQKRPPMKVQFEVKRNVLLKHHSALMGFVTKEASEDSRDLRGTHNPLYEVMRQEVDVGVQAVRRKTDTHSQTYFARTATIGVQAEPTLVDACIRHISLPKKEAPEMSAFLKKVLPRTLHCLTQNEEIPIYTDDYAFKEDDALVGAHDDLALVEKGNYTHAVIKDRQITSICWRSARRKDDFVCITSIAKQTLEERIEANRHCEGSLSLVWEFSDPMHPRYLLEAPAEVQVLQFCPSQSNIVAGASMSGQVFLWDLSKAQSVPGFQAGGEHTAGGATEGVKNTILMGEFKEAGDVQPMSEHVAGVTLDSDGDVMVPRLQPFQVSRVEVSHRRAVHDLHWLPANVEFGFDGRQTVVEGSRQFATISDDGSILVWDVRPEFQPPEKLRKIRHQSKASGEDVPWVPLLKYTLTKPDGSSDLMGFRFFVDGLMADKETPSYHIAVGTTDGEFSVLSLVTHMGQSHALVPAYGNTKDTRCVRDVVQAHTGCVFCVQRHPTIGDVYLTCGDRSFKVWRDGLATPLYSSPYFEEPVTCAAWSPVRPAIVFIGTLHGKIEVWDLLDRNIEPLLVHHMVQDAITSLCFKPAPAQVPSSYNQQLAVGTALGTFHWYILPSVLSKSPSGEKRQFRRMLEREVRRAQYYTWRWHERQTEYERYGSGAPKMLSDALDVLKDAQSRRDKGDGRERGSLAILGDGQSGHKDPNEAADENLEQYYEQNDERDAEFLELVQKLNKLEEERMRAEVAV